MLYLEVALVVASLALVLDLRQRRVPNQLTMAALVVGAALRLSLEGPPGLVQGLAGAGLGLALLLPFHLAGGVGAGDVKLLAGLGALLGPAGIVTTAVYGALVGGLMALPVLIRSGVLAPALHHLLVLRTPPSLRSGVTLPYGVAIAFGVYLSAVLPPVLR